MASAHVRGVDLHYEIRGAGESCVVIAHGALGSIAHTEAFGLPAGSLAAHGFRVISYDARGHGSSGYSSRLADYQPAALADDLLGLLDVIGVERVNVYGTSMGASTALMLASSHPDRVGRLVLRAPSPFGADMARARARLYPLATMYQWLGGSVTPSIATLLSYRRDRTKLRSLLSRQRRRAIVPALRGFLSAPLNPEILGRVTAPSLILAQPDDPLHPLRSGEILRERLASAELLVAPARTGWEDDTTRLAHIIAAWLKNLPRGSSCSNAST